MQVALQVAYDVIIPILLTAGLGFWFGRQFKPDTRTLSRIAIYLFSPALVFRSTVNSTLKPEEIGQILVFVVLLFTVISLLGYGLAATQHNLSRATRSAFILSVLLANSGNYGLSFVEFTFGQPGLQIAVLVVVMNSVMSNTLGIYLASAGTASMRQGILNVLKVPIPYATVLGFLVNFSGFTLPVPVERSVDVLSQAAVPIMIVLLGIQLSRISIRGELRTAAGALALASATRLLIAPLVILGITALMGISGLTRNVLLVQMSTPTAVFATLLATEFGSDAQFVTASVLITTLASIVSLSVITALFVG
ncbi:MAG: AEC family transporter [Anaerolineae bacterium]|nr:AEC family transporter [Anaerolineae bacterium]